MRRVLDHFDVRYQRARWGWQQIHCPNQDAHRHGDKTPSASVSMALGKFHCHACDLHGDGFDLMLRLEGKEAKDVMATLDMTPGKEESEWLI